MLLAIDAGNTNLVFALVEDSAIRARWRIATDPRRTADQYAVWLHQLLELEGYTRADVDAVMIGTVVPRALTIWKCLRANISVSSPWSQGRGGRLGSRARRRRAALGRRRPGAERDRRAPDHPGDLIVIDFGTATTFDVVDFTGAYKGGIIAPGINLSLDALVTAAAKLPRIAIAAPASRSVIGRTTEDQMLVGIFWGYVAMIEGLVARTKTEIGRPARVIATGGLAILFDTHTAAFDAIEPDLTIQGLALLYKRVSSTT
jgi:type III pantothenate kinase